jgi:hypothetical protein
MLALLLTAVVVQSSSSDISGVDGACRGPGGANDKVESKHKGSTTLAECQQECDDNSASCKGYAYNAAAHGGDCIIYGPGFAGSCSDTSVSSSPYATQGLQTACGLLGTCATDSSKTSEETCGECTGFEDAEEKSTCEDVISETWNAGTWTKTPGTWTGPTGGWTGDYHMSNLVVGTSPNAGYKCYDLDAEDHHPKCEGGANCAAAFAGLAKDDKVTGTCPTDSGCTYTAEIKAQGAPKPNHEKVTKVSGWDYNMGVCRSGNATDMRKPDNKDSNTVGANDEAPTNEECMQHCVDAGDGCLGYSHGSPPASAWCILYGAGMCTVPADLDNLDYSRPGWKGYCQNNPDPNDDITITQRKPNHRYICVTKNADYGKVIDVNPSTSSTDRRGIMVALFSLSLTCFFQ